MYLFLLLVKIQSIWFLIQLQKKQLSWSLLLERVAFGFPWAAQAAFLLEIESWLDSINYSSDTQRKQQLKTEYQEDVHICIHKTRKKKYWEGNQPSWKGQAAGRLPESWKCPQKYPFTGSFLAVVSKLQSSEIGSILDKDVRINHSTVNGFFGKFRETEFPFLGLKGNECTQFSTLLLDFVSIYPLQQSLVPVTMAAGT